MNSSRPFLLKLYFLAGALESAVVSFLLLSAPSENAIFFGYSLQRLLLLGVVFIPLLFFGLLLLRMQTSDAFSQTVLLFVEGIHHSRAKYLSVHYLSLLLAWLGIVTLLMPLERLAGFAAYAERLSPLFYLGGLIGAQTLLGQFLWRGASLNWRVTSEWKKLFFITGLVLGFLAAVSVWVHWTGIGLDPEPFGWHAPGTPVLFSQLFLAWLAALPFIRWGDEIEARAANLLPKGLFRLRLDAWICLALWLAALLIWWAEPVRRDSYFTPTPTAPNFEYYPHSDAAIYDLSAQNILIGADQNNKIVLRPLYVFFLAFLRSIVGQQYQDVIFLQIVFFALIPVLGYVLASMLGGRPAGLMTAIMLILREKNSIALTNVIEVSHSKLLLSDVPAMAFMLLTIYILLRWLRNSSGPNYLGVLAGVSFGLLVLTRSHQSLFIIPALLIGMMFADGFQVKRAFQRVAIFALGFAVVVTPWVLRNNAVNGKPAIESSEFYISWYAGAYTEPEDTVDILPGESLDAYSGRIRRQVFQYILDHPVELARISASYYIRNEIASVLAMPMSLRLYDLRLYINRTNFWNDPLVHFSFGSGLLFFITIGLIVFGTAIVVQRLGFIGVVPLLVHFTYNSSMSFARISGWRFIQPVDWILIMYYCIGLIALTTLANSWSSKTVVTINQRQAYMGLRPDGKRQWIALSVFLLFGLSLPLTEILTPERYPAIDESQLIAQYGTEGLLIENGDEITASDVKKFLEAEPAAVVLYGRAVYPLFYERGEYWGDDSYPRDVRDDPRLQFRLIGPVQAFVYIPMTVPPLYFPNGSDVFIVGCKADTAIRAIIVRVNGLDFSNAHPWTGLTCSIP